MLSKDDSCSEEICKATCLVWAGVPAADGAGGGGGSGCHGQGESKGHQAAPRQ